MSIDKLVDSTQLDSDLTSVANAIRNKGGTSAQLAFPAGFVSAIGDIETGGGGVSVNGIVSDLYKLRVSGDIILDDAVTNVGKTILAGNPITSLRGDHVTHISGNTTFKNCSSLESVHFPELIQMYSSECFSGCASLQMICFPNLGNEAGIRYFDGSVFANCSNLEIADLGNLGDGSRGLNSNTFLNCTKLHTLILRKTSQNCGLTNVNAFNGTPFASDGTGGIVYVPQARIESYQAATNWSTILGYENNQILPIEGSIYETQYADGTPITT